jgi:prevent-host-death family protein
MATVGIRALKQNASEIVRQAAAGDVITITDRGKPVAQIVPLRTSRLDEMRHAGLVRRASVDPADLPMPSVEITDGPKLSDILRDLRDDERY